MRSGGRPPPELQSMVLHFLGDLRVRDDTLLAKEEGLGSPVRRCSALKMCQMKWELIISFRVLFYAILPDLPLCVSIPPPKSTSFEPVFSP